MAGKKQNQAILELEQKLRDNPQSRAFSRLADSYRRAGNLQTAIDLCLEGLTEHPDYVTGRIVLGRCYAQQKKYDAAVGELTRVCTADRRNHAAMKMLADIFVRQGRAETAGRIYAILRDMEPDNYHVRQLAAKYRSNIRGTIFEVLGISTNTENVTRNLVASGVNPFDMGMETLASQTLADGGGGWTQTGNAPAAREPAGADIEAQLDSMFVTQDKPAAPPAGGPAPVARAAEPSGQPSGSDVADQLDMMFGQKQAPPAVAAPAMGVGPDVAQAAEPSGQPSGSDVADQLDMMFGQKQAPPAAPAPAMGVGPNVTQTIEDVGQPSGGLTGSDVADQLDIMFGQQPSAPPASAAPAPTQAPTPTPAMGIDPNVTQTIEQAGQPSGGLTGSDVADQLDMMFGQQQTLSMDAGAVSGLDTGVITSAASDEPSSGVADQLDIMFGQEQAAPMDAGAMSGLDTGVITPAASDEPTGGDVADQLDIMFGQEQAPSMDASEMSGLDTGIITSAASDEPTGSDVADQLDIMFGQQPQSQSLSAPVKAETVTGGEPSGSDIEDRLDALFGNIAAPAHAAPKASADFSTSVDALIAEAQGGEAPGGAPAAEDYFNCELVSEPDRREAAPAPADSGETPANLFDFNDSETMQIDKGDMLAAMGAGRAADAAPEEENLADAPAAVEHNLTEAITFKPNVPEEGAEIVQGEDIEDRLSELFSDSEKTGVPAPAPAAESGEDADDTIEDIVDEAAGVISAQELAGIEGQPEEILDEALPESGTISSEPDVITDLSSTELSSVDVNKAKNADADIDAILASVDADVDATMSGIDTNAISSESDIITELPSTELSSVDELPSADIANELPSAELPSKELSSKDKDVDTDIDAILASVDAEVDATMSGIDTNAISSESDIVTELSSADELPSAELSSSDITAELPSTELSSIDKDIDIEAKAETEAAMPPVDTTNAISPEHDASLKSLDDDAGAEAVAAPQPQVDAAELREADERYKHTEDDVQDKIRQLFKAEGSEPARIDVGADAADSEVDERDAPFDLPDHVLTPTLADIYLQQGQPRLALHIYERLALRDPGDERFAAKIQDIHDMLLQLPESEPEPEPEPPYEPPVKKSVAKKITKTTETKAAGRKKKGDEPKEDRRPLAGVRIKKKDSSTSKSKRKPS